MTNMRKLTKLSAIAMALVIALSMMSMLFAACGKATISLDKTELNLYVGDSAKLTATVSDDSEVEWETSDSAVATVRKGTVIAAGVGSATITAKLENGQSATCSVSVEDRTVTISQTSGTINLDESATLQLSATASDGGAISWSSSNPAVATVDNSGLVTGLDVGTATITAMRGAAKATCEIEVTEPSRPEDYYEITKETNANVIGDPGVWHYHADGSLGSTYDFDGKVLHQNGTASATLTTIPNPADSQFFYFRYQPNQVEVGEYYTMTLKITLTESAELRIGSKGEDGVFAALKESVTANEEKEVVYVGYRNTSEPFSVRIESTLDVERVTFSVKLVSVVKGYENDLPDYHIHEKGPEKNYEEIGKDTSSYELEAKTNGATLEAPGQWYYNQGNGSSISEANYDNGTITVKYATLTANTSSNDQLRYRPEGLEGATNIKVEFTVTSNANVTVVLALTDVDTFKSEGWTENSLAADSTFTFSKEFTIKDRQIIFIQVRAVGEDKADVEFTFSNVKILKEVGSSSNNPATPGEPDAGSYDLNPGGNGDGSKGNVCANPGVWFYMVDNYEGVTLAESTAMTEAKMENGTLTWSLTKMEAKGYYLRYQPDLEVGATYKISFDVVINRTGDTVKPRSEGDNKYETKATTAGETVHVEFEGTVYDNNPFSILLNVSDASVENPVTIVISNIVVTAL